MVDKSNTYQQVDGHYNGRVVLILRVGKDKRQLRYPVRKPAKNIHSNDSKDQPCHFGMRFFSVRLGLAVDLGRVGLRPNCSELKHNLSVENENQEQWNGKAQNEGINCEDLLTTHSLKI